MPTRLFFGNGAVRKLAKARLPEGCGLIITGGAGGTTGGEGGAGGAGGAGWGRPKARE